MGVATPALGPGKDGGRGWGGGRRKGGTLQRAVGGAVAEEARFELGQPPQQVGLGRGKAAAEGVAAAYHVVEGHGKDELEVLFGGGVVAQEGGRLVLVVDDGHVFVEHEVEAEEVVEDVGGLAAVAAHDAVGEMEPGVVGVANVVQEAGEDDAEGRQLLPLGLPEGVGVGQAAVVGRGQGGGCEVGVEEGFELVPGVAAGEGVVAAGDGVEVGLAQVAE